MRRAIYPAGLVLALCLLPLTAAAQRLDLGYFRVIAAPAELGIKEYHYWKDGQVIIAQALDAERAEVATLELHWPGDMTVRIHCTTREGRDVNISFSMATAAVEFVDNRDGKAVSLAFDAATKRWVQAGGSKTAEEFAKSEEKLMGLVGPVYSDALANLNLNPNPAIRRPPSEAPGQDEVPTKGDGPGQTCRWALCNGPPALGGGLGLYRADCCQAASIEADGQCANLICAGCCTKTPCFSLCLVLDTFCSCTVEGVACGTEVIVDCEDWPPDCV